MRHASQKAALKRNILKLVDSKVHFPQVLTNSTEQFFFFIESGSLGDTEST